MKKKPNAAEMQYLKDITMLNLEKSRLKDQIKLYKVDLANSEKRLEHVGILLTELRRRVK